MAQPGAYGDLFSGTGVVFTRSLEPFVLCCRAQTWAIYHQTCCDVLWIAPSSPQTQASPICARSHRLWVTFIGGQRNWSRTNRCWAVWQRAQHEVLSKSLSYDTISFVPKFCREGAGQKAFLTVIMHFQAV